MTDFSRWDRFDVEAAEREIECQAELQETKRERIKEERAVLKACEDRAATLKSKAVVQELKAKRGSRRSRPSGVQTPSPSPPPPPRRSPSHTCPGVPWGSRTETIPVTDFDAARDGLVANGGIAAAPIPCVHTPEKEPQPSTMRTSANDAHALAKGLRRGLELRDEVDASVEAGELHRGVRKARECLAELTAAQEVLLKTMPQPPANDPSTERNTASANGTSKTPESACCGSRRGDAHDRHDGGKAGLSGHHHTNTNTYRGEDGNAPKNASETVGGSSCGNRRSTPQTAVQEGCKGNISTEGGMALKVLRRVKVACRVAEAACLVRGGRGAEATDALRDVLLLEDPRSTIAWVARGEAFLSIGNRLLAGLHFDRALELDSTCTAAAVHKERLRDFDPCNDDTVATVDNSGTVVPRASVVADVTVESCHKSIVPGMTSGPFPRPMLSSPDSPSLIEHTSNAMTAGGEDSNLMTPATAVQSVPSCVAISTACEEYRAGVVLHQEAFLWSSKNKFCRVLNLLDEAEAGVATTRIARHHDNADVDSGESERQSEGVQFKEGVGWQGHEGLTMPRPVGDGNAFAGSSAAVKKLRLGCHLNIAAAALLRKTDYEAAVDHCTRALTLQPGNCQALVRRAQAHEELGRFLLAVEDLEAAEASVSADNNAGAEDLAGELQEISRRLEHARWTKIHVGNGRDELPRAGRNANER